MILTEKSVTSSSAWIRFFDQTMTRLKFRLDGKDYTETEIISFFSSSNKALRKRSAKIFGETLKNNIHNFSFIYNMISKDLEIDKTIRGFEFSESSRHLLNQIEKTDVDSLVKTASDNYKPICHKYYKYKSKFFGKKKLDYWDRNAPYPRFKEKKFRGNSQKESLLTLTVNLTKVLGKLLKNFLKIHGSMLPLKKVKLPELFHIPQYQVVTQKFF